MRIGTDRLSSRHPDAGPSRCAWLGRQRGTSLIEVSLVLGILGILGGVGASTLDFGTTSLTATASEIHGSMMEAFSLARASGRNITVALGDSRRAPDLIPVKLPRKVKWGKPEGVPVPPGMAEPRRADETGEAHARITVTPRRTVTASAWFLNDGRDVLCMRVNGRGHINLLRWHKATGSWSRL